MDKKYDLERRTEIIDIFRLERGSAIEIDYWHSGSTCSRGGIKAYGGDCCNSRIGYYVAMRGNSIVFSEDKNLTRKHYFPINSRDLGILTIKKLEVKNG